VLAITPKPQVFEEHVDVWIDSLTGQFSAVEGDRDRTLEVDQFR
jgi:hypothetical protein